MRRLVLLAAIVVGCLAGSASGNCPEWPGFKPPGERFTAENYLHWIIEQADTALADPECPIDPNCLLDWTAVREVALWSLAHGKACGVPTFHTCDAYYHHVKAAHARSSDGDPVGCFNELDHID